jgi:TolB-like protein
VRRTADRVRVTAQLIDAREGANRWSETYDRPIGDTLQMQAEIAASLACVLYPLLRGTSVGKLAGSIGGGSQSG